MLGEVLFAAEGEEGESKVTLAGDLAAFGGSVAMAAYLVLGRRVRKWCPIWLYVFPVTFVAALTTVALAFLLSPSPVAGLCLDDNCVFGFFTPRNLLVSMYLGGGAGVGGHALLNYLLAELSPTVVATALLMEPLMGGLLGAAMGVQDNPGLWTWGGGGVLMIGLGVVIYGESSGIREGEGGTDRGSELVASLKGSEPGSAFFETRAAPGEEGKTSPSSCGGTSVIMDAAL